MPVQQLSNNYIVVDLTLKEKKQLYFKNAAGWRNWLHENHNTSKGVYLIFYRVGSKIESMRWEEAVQVALCYGWIDSTVKNLDHERRQQSFCPRKNKSVWSKLNKTYIEKLTKENLMQESGFAKIETAKINGSWTSLDAVEELKLPTDLEAAFNQNKDAYDNYQKFSPSRRKSYLYCLNQAKREETRNKRISEIISNCALNKKFRE